MLNRQVVTGIHANDSNFNIESISVASRDEFNSMVTDLYVLIREKFRIDINFFIREFECGKLNLLYQTIYKLRTAVQHSDNRECVDFYNSWYDKSGDWSKCAFVLNELYQDSLAELIESSAKCRQDRKYAAKWQSRLSVDSESVLESVLRDLCLSLNLNSKAHALRQIDNRVAGHRKEVDILILREFCIQEVLKRKVNLPVSYVEVLDRLSLIGRQEAGAALLLAYAVAAKGRNSPSIFFEKVEAAWAQIA